MKLRGLGLLGIAISMADFRVFAPEICGILHKEHLCPVVVNLGPLPQLIPFDQWCIIKVVDVAHTDTPTHSQQGPIPGRRNVQHQPHLLEVVTIARRPPDVNTGGEGWIRTLLLSSSSLSAVASGDAGGASGGDGGVSISRSVPGWEYISLIVVSQK